jgi:hypothetical protein
LEQEQRGEEVEDRHVKLKAAGLTVRPAASLDR